MRGVEVEVVSARDVSDDDVWFWCVVGERGAGEQFGEPRCRVPYFGCGVVGVHDEDGPRIMGMEVVVRKGGWVG